ncbi:MAG: response regulator [Lachnospiraceae bacterium]|nr:response regulator [Lachnospiraceae bacterium]
MILTYYNILFAFSILFLLFLSVRWQLRINIDFAVFFIIVPLDLLGYIRVAQAQTVNEAILANEFIYIGGAYLQLFAFLIVCDLCKITLKPTLRVSMFGLSTAIFLSTLTIGHNGFFYKFVSIEERNGVTVLLKQYGPMHTVFYLMIVGYMVATIWALIYGHLKKPEASIRNLYILSICMAIAVFSFFGGRAITRDVEFTPAAYVLAEIAFLFIAHRARLYNITGDIAENVLVNGADGLICFDIKKELLVANETARKIIPELRAAHADHVLPDQIIPFAEINKLIAQFEKNEHISSESMIIVDGNYYRVIIEYIKDGKKNVGYYVVLRDITERQKYLESIEKLNIKIQESADAAIAADNAKSAFLAQMSHEIRTPINAVLGMNEMILRECADKNILKYASAIDSSGHTLLFLINSILDFSKIEDGKMDIVNGNYDVTNLIANLLNTAKTNATDKNLELNSNIDENLPSVLYGDDVRINQVISNLLSNAVKYTDKGSITLTINALPKAPDCPDDEIDIRYEVADTGIGIKPEDISRMFESFERLDVYRNRYVEGTGLGMTIVYRLLEMMGSKINVESTYGKGSVFWFVLRQKVVVRTPIGNYKEKAATVELRSKKNITLYAPNTRILVVDDNSLNIKVARNYLKLCGIVPDEAMTGLEALELVHQKTYDIIFLDHMMPGMDGIETFHRMKEDNVLPDDTVVIVFTANALEGSREMYLNEGFDDYIAKPVELNAMVRMVEKYVNQKS